ncbi:MAG: hypothetical protein ABJG86_09820 [Nitratireductor sp.]|uniref:hypothetical protein n=1 Tax=Parvibaculum sp. TaxID=2024848 RepID=UPI00329279BE
MTSASPLPLLTWRKEQALAHLRMERMQLARRIAALPPMSHRRVELVARLKELTARELSAEIELSAGVEEDLHEHH